MSGVRGGPRLGAFRRPCRGHASQAIQCHCAHGLTDQSSWVLEGRSNTNRARIGSQPMPSIPSSSINITSHHIMSFPSPPTPLYLNTSQSTKKHTIAFKITATGISSVNTLCLRYSLPASGSSFLEASLLASLRDAALPLDLR